MKKILFSLWLVGAALTLQSCLHDDDEVFDTPAAQRIEETVQADKALLESAPNGWLFEYYLGEEAQYGGYTYLVRFENGKAYVSGDLADADLVTSSSYDVVKDMGPVLTFNTYNEIMHFNSQPYQDMVDGYEGDYEFLILSATQDSIKLKGKKWGNHMLLTRLPESVVWEDYLNEVDSIKNIINYTYGIHAGTDSIGYVEMDEDFNLFGYTVDGVDYEVPFVFTNDGIKLKESIELKGASAQHFRFDADTNKLVCTDSGTDQLSFNWVKPEGWLPYETFLGDWEFKGSTAVGSSVIETNRTVTLLSDGKGSAYTAKNMSEYGDVTVRFDKVRGSLAISPQLVGYVSRYGCYDYLCAFGGGYLVWGGTRFRGRNTAADPLTVTFDNKDGWATILEFAFTNETPNGNEMEGYLTAWPSPLVLVKKQ